MKRASERLIAFATVLLMLVIVQGRGGRVFAGQASPANTAIVNAASATWSDGKGNAYQILSNQVVVSVQGVSALTVTPKEAAVNPAADGYPVGQNVTRTFVITNVSNIADAYRITSFSADRGSIVSLAFVTPGGNVPVTIGTTVSPTLQPGESIAVQAVVATAGVSVGGSFALHLTAQTTAAGTANGLQTDNAQLWLIAANGPSLGGPGGANTPVSKTVDRSEVLQTQGGAVVTFDVVVKNNGGTPATNAVMTDTIPQGLTANLSTVKINGTAAPGATLSGQALTVPLGTIEAGMTDDVSFDSQVVPVDTLGTTYVNVASVSADGIAPLQTTPAAVLIGTADIVFDPASANAPVGGATVSLLDQNNALVPLSAPAASAIRRQFAALPAAANTANPYVTGADGTYGFALQPSQIAAAGTRFYITIHTPGYMNRRIEMFVTPSSIAGLYDVLATSRDNQPLAAAGGYALTSSSVSLNDIFGLFGNLPLFRSQTIAIDKIVDRSSAQPGDRLTYTVDVSNPSGSTLTAARIVDTLPAGEAYAPGSSRIDGASQEPLVNGRTLTWQLAAIGTGLKHRIVYAAVVHPSVPGGTILTNSVAAHAEIAGTMVNVNAAANADVIVTQGALSDRSIITGRVYVDASGAGHFVRGDRPIAGARVFLEDGSSALTDAQGRFSFAAVRPGMHVLRVDKTTIPDGARGELQRLVHGVLDDGLMQDVEFGVRLP